MKKTAMIAAMASACLFCMETGAQATPLVGGQLFATGGNISLTINNSSASYLNLAVLVKPFTLDLGSNKEVGKTIDLGAFASGTELVFKMLVTNTLTSFFTGNGMNNPDGLAHASVDFLSPGVAQVRFEDIYGGGDFDFNDLVFTLSGGVAPAPVPEPTTALLLGVGLVSLAAVGRRKLQ